MIIDILGWVAFVLVIPAALFQIIKNFKRKSVAGVSRLMFLSLFLGLGIFSVISVVEPTPIPTTVQFFVGSTSAGIVLLQMTIYRDKRPASASPSRKASGL